MDKLYSFISKAILSGLLFLMCANLYLQAKVPDIWNLPHTSQVFIGREEPLKRLHSLIQKSPVVLITGLSGTGKTSLALHYARQSYAHYNIVWKFDGGASLETQFKRLCLALAPLVGITPPNFSEEREYIGYTNNLLRKTPLKWLLIFDDLKNGEIIQDLLPETHGMSDKHIIVTANRNMLEGTNLKLKNFDRSESLSYLKHYLTAPLGDKDLERLSISLGDHPLALKQAVSYFNNVKKTSLSKYLKLIEQQDPHILSLEEKLSMKEHPNPILSKSIQASLKKLREDEPHAYELLCTLCLLDTQHLDEKLIEEWTNLYKDSVSPLVLKKYFFLDEASSQEKKTFYSIHTYVRYVVLSQVQPLEKENLVLKAANLFMEIKNLSAEKVTLHFDTHPHDLSHLKSLFKNLSFPHEDLLSLKIRTLYYIYYYLRDYNYGFSLAKEIAEGLQRAKFKDTLEIARFYNMYSYISYINAGLDAAIQESHKAIKILENFNTTEARNELIMALGNSLGLYYVWQGDLENAQACSERITGLLKEKAEDSSKVVSLGLNLKIALQKNDKKSCQRFIKDFFEIASKNSLLNEVCGFHFKGLESKMYLKEGQIEKARSAAQEGYNLAFRTAGNVENHEIVARTAIYLAACENHLSKSEKARELVETAIKSFNTHFKNEKRSARQAYAHMVKGDILVNLGELSNALEAYKFSESIYLSTLKNLSLDDVSELYVRLVNLGVLMKETLLIQEYFNKHLKHFGLTHPRTLEIVKLLDEKNIEIPWEG